VCVTGRCLSAVNFKEFSLRKTLLVVCVCVKIVRANRCVKCICICVLFVWSFPNDAYVCVQKNVLSHTQIFFLDGIGSVRFSYKIPYKRIFKMSEKLL